VHPLITDTKIELDPASINNHGRVIGSAALANDEIRAFWWQGGTLQFLPDLPKHGSGIVEDINDKNQIVGHSYPFGQTSRAILWNNGKPISLGTLGGRSSRALSINNQGQITGFSETKSGVEHAFLWQNGRMIDLGTLGGENSQGRSINNKGQIVGFAQGKDGYAQAFIWSEGKMEALRKPKGSLSAGAVSINDKGQVVGTAAGAKGGQRAYLWKGQEDPKLIGSSKYGNSAPVSINNNGDILIMADTAEVAGEWRLPVSRPFLHSGNKLYAVNKLVNLKPNSPITKVFSINDSAQIVGIQRIAGLDRAVILRPSTR
jgi:probable HAF family extracellular repeat protein